MPWHNIFGHDDVVERFRRALVRGRLASTFLFVGPEGIGKRTFALKLAQAMLCQQRPEEAMDPCETCNSCTMVAAGTHPDIDQVGKPEEKSVIPVETFIGDREHRMQEGLCHRIGLRPFMGGRKIAIIDDADYLNAEGANCLLKTLEEPPPRSVLILIGTSPAKQLPTIRSRCQMVRFRPLPAEDVARLLVARQLVQDPAEARRLAGHAEGSVQRAVELAEPALWEFRGVLLEQLARPILDSVGLAKMVAAYVDEAGKDAPPRRARLRQATALAAEFYRQLLHAQSGATSAENDDFRRHVDLAIRNAPDTAVTAARLERCLTAAQQIDRNANQATLIEAWLDDVAAGRSGNDQ